MAAQIIYLILIIMSLTLHLVKHGEYRVYRKYNFWLQCTENIFLAGLLYWGGFFDVLIK